MGESLAFDNLGMSITRRAATERTLTAMTIREFLKHRTRKLALVAVLGWLVCAMTPLIFGIRSHCHLDCRAPPTPTVFPITLALGLPLFAGGMVGMLFFVKCPRCSGRLTQVAMTLVMPTRYTRVMNFCPYCGVSIDEQMPTRVRD